MPLPIAWFDSLGEVPGFGAFMVGAFHERSRPFLAAGPGYTASCEGKATVRKMREDLFEKAEQLKERTTKLQVSL